MPISPLHIPNKPFHIYRSSAGSGKTHALVKMYLKLALSRDKDYFSHILAVTFTHKATQEMKERILHYVSDLASEQPRNDFFEEMQKELGYTGEQLKQKNKVLLSSILHQYSRFFVVTIDAFFQRVIRSFARETGLSANFRLEVENDNLVLKEVIIQLMEELGENEQLSKWVLEFARDRLMEGQNWNILFALEVFAKEIFREEFKIIEHRLEKPSDKINPYQEKIKILKKEVSVFENYLKGKACEALELLDKNGITVDDFNYKNQGTVFKYFQECKNKKYYSPNTPRIQNALHDPLKWYERKKRDNKAWITLTQDTLIPIVQDMVEYDDRQGRRYRSVRQALKNFYAVGLIADILRKMNSYRRENNLMLLSDTPQLIQRIIHNSDVPFLYEKVGSYYRHYLMDEFQDTSGLQWNNFFPLLKEALDQGCTSLLVGDVKQSVYRWRGGEQQLLQQRVEHDMGEAVTQIKTLNTNYRSAERIVQFNNLLFKQASDVISEITADHFAKKSFHDVCQKTSRFPDKGYVRISFLEKMKTKEEEMNAVLQKIPLLIEELQDRKIRIGDIAILTRRNEEGQRIATALSQYKNTQGKPGYRYDVISSESLRLDAAPTVRILLNALKYLHNPLDAMIRGQLAYEIQKEETVPLDNLFQKASASQMENILPEALMEKRKWLVQLSVYEQTEELISILGLGIQEGDRAYLQAFQDAVLEFSSLEKNDLSSFLDWWEYMKTKRSIQVAGDRDAVNILTIHKAKGLQFKYVIIPFLNWNLDHERAPLLWVEPNEPPFEKMGCFAVRYSSKGLKNTCFEQAYHAERAKAYLDNLNLLYVSCTRAEEGLIAYTFVHTESKNLTTVGDLVYHCINRVPDLKAGLNENEFSMGTLEPLGKNIRKATHEPVLLNGYTSSNWRNKLIFKKKIIPFSQSASQQKENNSYYGILLHKLLALMRYKDDMDSVPEDFYIQHALTEQERNRIHQSIQDMMREPFIAEWFERKWHVRTEASILTPSGMEYRIDRIMTMEGKTILVDYKTGEATENDVKQMENYIELLEQMAYSCRGYLLYLYPLKIVEVLRPGTLSTEKNHKKQ